MVNNEQLVTSYELLGLPPGTALEQAHKVYLEQLDVWNPMAIDEDANPSLYQQVKLRRQSIDEAHRCIVEYHEQLEAAGEAAGTVGGGGEPAIANAESMEASASGPPGIAEQPGAGWVGDDAPVDEAPNPAPEDQMGLEHPASEPSNTFVQSTGQMLPAGSSFAVDDADVIPLSNSRVAPSYDGDFPDGDFHDGEESSSPSAIFQLLRWDKPAGRVILMIPALWAAFLASGGGMPSWRILIIIVLGSIATSAAGCAVNDLWDQEFDSQVARTQNRPLAAGRMSRRTAQIVLAICCVVSILLALQLNWVSIQLCVAAGIVILLYPGAKRVFPVPQLVLAIAWGFAVLIGWAAVTGALSFTTFLLWLATVLWTLGFDTVYAMADQEDDRRIGLNSSALFFADKTPDVVGLFFAGTALFMLFVGIKQGLSWQFWLTLVLATVGWLQQHRNLSKSQARPTSRLYSDIFTQNVWLGILLLAGMILGRPFV